MKNVLLVGAGPMAVEYAKVLNALEVDFITIGRGKESALLFKEKAGMEVVSGGLSNFLQATPEKAEYAIVATGVESLAQNTLELIKAGCKNILCEKPGGLNSTQIEQVSIAAAEYGANVFLAYNRRFYSSVLKAKEIIEEDGGVTSFNFEFTEWSHVIAPLVKGKGVKEHWFLGNSTHVVDLAFFLGGIPKEICCYTAGGLEWHPSASNFSGAGISEKGALFSYQANWEAPGRWAVEVLTKNHRLYFKPMEKLHIQKKGSVQVELVEMDDAVDLQFKAGLFQQTKAFLDGDVVNFIDIHQQALLMPYYNKMAGYSDRQ